MGFLRPGLSLKDSALLCHKLHTSYAAGIPLKRALSLLAGERRRTNPGAQVAGDLLDCLERGATFWQAAHWNRRRLPAFFVALVEAGEKSGTLDKALATLTRYYEDCADLNRRLWRELTYPICLVLAISIGIPILQVVLLSVTGQQASSASPLGDFLHASLGISIDPLFFAIAGIIVAGLEPFFLAGMFIAVFSRIPRMRALVTSLLFRIPLAGKFLQRLSVLRFAHGMALMDSAGYAPHHAVWVAARGAVVPRIALDFATRAEFLRNGLPYARAFADSPYLSGEQKRYLETGDETGTADEAFATIARDEQDKLRTLLRGLIPCLGVALLLYIAAGHFLGQGTMAAMIFVQLKHFLVDRPLALLGLSSGL